MDRCARTGRLTGCRLRPSKDNFTADDAGTRRRGRRYGNRFLGELPRQPTVVAVPPSICSGSTYGSYCVICVICGEVAVTAPPPPPPTAVDRHPQSPAVR